jgi:hypothetical protein
MIWIAVLGSFLSTRLAWADLIMVGYGLAANLPCTLAQRYNHPRLRRVLARLSQAGWQGGKEAAQVATAEANEWRISHTGRRQREQRLWAGAS